MDELRRMRRLERYEDVLALLRPTAGLFPTLPQDDGVRGRWNGAATQFEWLGRPLTSMRAG